MPLIIPDLIIKLKNKKNKHLKFAKSNISKSFVLDLFKKNEKIKKINNKLLSLFK